MNAVSKKPRAHNETLNFISIKNDSIITPETDFLNFDTFDEPLDERNIELNYELYAAAVFLFALGQISQWYVNTKYQRADHPSYCRKYGYSTKTASRDIHK